MAAARQYGLITRALPGDGVGICPPLIITETQVNDMFDRYLLALDTVHQKLSGQKPNGSKVTSFFSGINSDCILNPDITVIIKKALYKRLFYSAC